MKTSEEFLSPGCGPLFIIDADARWVGLHEVAGWASQQMNSFTPTAAIQQMRVKVYLNLGSINQRPMK